MSDWDDMQRRRVLSDMRTQVEFQERKVSDLQSDLINAKFKIAGLQAQMEELLQLVKEVLYHPDMPIAENLANKYPQLGSLHTSNIGQCTDGSGTD